MAQMILGLEREELNVNLVLKETEIEEKDETELKM